MTEKRSGKECKNISGGKYHHYHHHINISSNIKFYLKYLFYEKFFVNFTISKLNQIVCGIADTDFPNSNKNHPCVSCNLLVYMIQKHYFGSENGGSESVA